MRAIFTFQVKTMQLAENFGTSCSPKTCPLSEGHFGPSTRPMGLVTDQRSSSDGFCDRVDQISGHVLAEQIAQRCYHH